MNFEACCDTLERGRVSFDGRDLITTEVPDHDSSLRAQVILAGDVCYEPDLAKQMLQWLTERVRSGQVSALVGDPGRHIQSLAQFRTVSLDRNRAVDSRDDLFPGERLAIYDVSLTKCASPLLSLPLQHSAVHSTAELVACAEVVATYTLPNKLVLENRSFTRTNVLRILSPTDSMLSSLLSSSAP